MEGLASAHPEARFFCCFRPHRLWRSLALPLAGNCRRRVLSETRALASADIFHGLNQRLPAARYRRAASTFHDLFVLTGDYSTPEFRERFARQAREAAARSDLIISVSRFTADQVEALLGVDPARMRVIPHGVHTPFAASGARREAVILHVGAIQRRKNVARLVTAFEGTPTGWRLVLAGSTGYGAEETLDRIARSPRRSDISVTGYLSDRRLEQMYARASVFAFPSLDEGFGMPVLEAMARGLPVLASNRSAMPEVAGEAAMLVDPEDTDALRCALCALCEDQGLRARLAQQGLKRAENFSWRAAVDATWRVYEELG